MEPATPRRAASALARTLKTLAGLEKDEPWTSMHVALYGFLGLIGFILVTAWVTGTPIDCTPTECSHH